MPNDPSPPRLLVVDDVDDNRTILARRFGRLGFEVIEAENGERALERVKVESFDVVLLDIMMPGIDGLEVLRVLRETYSQDQLPIIMVSAKASSEDVVDGLLLGANDYITKPVDLKIAQARVEAQLARKRADDASRAAQRDLQRSLETLRGALASPEASGEAPPQALGAKLEIASAISRLCERPGFEDMIGLLDGAIDLLRQMSTTLEPEAPGQKGRTDAIRILSIDADAQDREVVRQMLFEAARAVEVIELTEVPADQAPLQDRRFDLLILSWRGADPRAAAFVQAIRAREAKAGEPRMPIVALSDAREDNASAMAAGADLHLVKPLTAAGLLNAVVGTLSETAAGARAPA
ncbi:MAG TPA: response regulator [Phenylobacterium sp.]|jgi:DNA-binding response OmpR family regulator|nr:response regulator [Phenylobacterium sp.]